MDQNFVRVAADGIGKRIDNVKFTSVLPGGFDAFRQVIAFGDPDDYSLIAKVRSVMPGPADAGIVTRLTPPDFDTGFNAPGSVTPNVLQDATNVLQTDSILLEGLWISVSGAVSVQVELTDGVGHPLIPAGMTFYGPQFYALPLPPYGMPLIGLRWAAGSGTVLFKAWGRKQ